ncbi:alpha/beta hydrolase fold domain-containing protein [Tabrizicola oligotrophica]|uniref:Alpha/beta hydrolase n=1 Tax=Tabrizicola oligotrophica TaxID=2710650 RepID=A0A6M0QT98_9RHOB|nr:alpha/beta hydrolase [Tabrizicola oligotrophica]NEY89873.1 alpha/beta hydrolase [Tabrizicola oligotrophica]
MTAVDYQSLIDAPTWAFIEATNAAYPPDTATLTIADQRAIYDRMCRLFHRGYPPGLAVRDENVAGVPCRIYAGKAPAVIYLHGGGHVVGGLHSHDDVCAEICDRTGLTVVAVDYRLSPENLHPAAFDDACAVIRAVAAEGPVVLAGDSAGGNLAAAAAHALRGSGVRLLGQVLIYPGLGGEVNKGSYLTHAHAPMLSRDDVLFYKDIRHGGPPPEDDPTVYPLRDRDFTGLPPTLAIGAQCDPLADDARDYAARIKAAGGQADWVEEPGLVHGYLRARATVPRAAASFARIVNAISTFAKGDQP